MNDKISQDIKDTVNNQGNTLHEGFQKVSNAVSDMASHAAHSIKENSEDAVNKMTNKGGEYVKQAENVVKEDPIRVALICLGVGFLLGRAFSK